LAWADGVLTVDCKQTHASGDLVPHAFELPLCLDVVTAGGRIEQRKLVVTQRTEAFAVPCAERPKFVVVDPEMRILGEDHLKAPGDMLRSQLAHGKSARA